MSYIAPNSTIRLLSDVPLNNTYTDTLYFDNESDQNNYFASKIVANFTEQTYQRVNKGQLRVNICADDVYDCNYLMFRNTSFNTKWFYAFITRIDYINNAVCEVNYELDVMQTWLFEMDLGQCFIERQHTVSDNLYENYMPENLDTGDYIVDSDCYDADKDELANLFEEKVYVVCTVPLDDEEYIRINGYYSQCEYYTFEDNATSCRSFFENIMSARDAEGVISCYRFFKRFVNPNNSSDTVHKVSDTARNTPVSVDLGWITMPSTIDGYTPKNNRLFCSPYTVVCVTDNSSNSQYYKPEFFETAPRFTMTATIVGQPCVMCVPYHYKQTGDSIEYNYEEAFTVSGYPMSAVAQDTYEAWLATSGFSNALGVMGGVSSLANGLMSGNVFYAGIGLTGALNAINQYQVMSGAPNKAITTDNSDIIDAVEMKYPMVLVKTVTAEYAKRIDMYFTRYGYNYGKVEVPNTHARKYFTYVKTQDCTVNGSIPSDDAKKICSIFNKGITHWAEPEYVGDYTVSNDCLE